MDDITRGPAGERRARPGRTKGPREDRGTGVEAVAEREFAEDADDVTVESPGWDEDPDAGARGRGGEPEGEPDGAPADDREGLPEVPALETSEALARIVFVLVLTQRDGLSLLRLAQACNTTQKKVEAAIEVLRARIEQLDMPVELTRTGDTIKLLSGAEAFPFLQRLRGVKKMEKLSPAALETLAVVAYRQPVIRAEIEAIRGVKAGPMLRTLLSHKLVRVTGRADVPGRPLQYGTTQRFLERFGLASLQELPSIKEFKQLG